MEALQSHHRLKWDKNIEKMQSVHKLGKVNLIQQVIKPHPLMSQKRDMFYKQIGFAHRATDFPVKDHSVSNYFYFSSMDSKDSETLCPVETDVSRTHVFFGMQKFETVTLPIKSDATTTNEDSKEADDQINSSYRHLKTKKCV